MARLAVAEGTRTIIATPHQLGSYGHNSGETIRQKVIQLNALLEQQSIPLTILPGADVRIEADMITRLRQRDVLSLAEQKYVLLELPHEMYLPLAPVLEALRNAGYEGILSHPERNQGLLRQPELIESLVAEGCLMQVTAGSLAGTFGPACQHLAEDMLVRRQTHFIATDAHGSRARRPLMRRAFERVIEITDEETAIELCCRNPQRVVEGAEVPMPPQARPKRSLVQWFGLRKAG